MTEFLSVDVRVEGDRKRVAPDGEVDLSTVDVLRAALESDAVHIELDLSKVTFIDSSGLGVLLEADAAARSNGHELRMFGASPAVRRILEIAGVDGRLQIANE